MFNAAQDHLLAAARAHIDTVLLDAFVHGIEKLPEGPERDLLIGLCDLFALSTIEAERGLDLRTRPADRDRSKAVVAAVNELCARLRPHARTLVDAFGVPDEALAAPHRVLLTASPRENPISQPPKWGHGAGKRGQGSGIVNQALAAGCGSTVYIRPPPGRSWTPIASPKLSVKPSRARCASETPGTIDTCPP